MGLCQDENKLKEKKSLNEGEKIIHKNPKIYRINPYLANISKSICKLGKNNDNKHSSGFLIKFDIRNQELFCLITIAHFIDKYMIENKEKIYFYYDNNIKKEICLNPEERYIDILLYPHHINAAIIEIIPTDNIPKEFFLLPDLDYMNDINKVYKKEITIAYYPLQDLGYSNGMITDVEKYEFRHDTTTEAGTLGCPIFLKNTNKVLGIQKGGSVSSQTQFGDFIWPISEYLNNHNIEIKSFKNSSSKVIDKPISVHFITNDQIINYALPAYPNELFSSVVNKLYEIYPEYKNKESYFICGGNKLDLNYTMAQNKYQSGAKILVIND